MTLPEWYSDEANAAQLTDLLNHPVLIKALTVIESANTPAFRAGVSTTDLALIHSFQAGVHHVRRTLGVLTRPPAQPQELPPAWEGEHIVPNLTQETE